MRRLLLILISVFVVAISTLLFIQYAFNDASNILVKIEENLDRVIVDQKEDLENFAEQFAIYSNPFDIFSDSYFNKRVFINGELVYWSDNSLIGKYSSIKSDEELYILNKKKNLFVVQRKKVSHDGSLIEIYSFLPLLINPPIKNSYLKEIYNEDIFHNYNLRLGKGDQLVTSNNLTLKVEVKDQPLYRFDEFILILGVLACCLILAFIWRVYSNDKQKWLVITISLIALRGVIWFFSHQLVSTTLFNPLYYTSNYGSSLGDLFLNLILLFAFIQYLTEEVLPKLNLANRWLNLILSIVLLHAVSFLLFKVSWSIQNNSLISLDISESIFFDTHRIFAYLILLTTGMLFFKVFNAVQSYISSFSWLQLVIPYFIVMGVFILVVGEPSMAYFIVLATIISLVYFTKTGFDLVSLDYKSFIYLSLIIIFIAGVYTLSEYQHYKKSGLISKERFANRLLIKNDFLGEYYLNEKMSLIRKDAYIRSRLGNGLLDNSKIEQKIKRDYLSSYFDKYEVDVFLFDRNGSSVDELETSFADFEESYSIESNRTDYENIFFVQDKEGNIQDKYYCFIPVSSFDSNVGFIVLALTLKKYIPKSVFPQLMVESRYYFSDQNEFDYAVYKEGKLLYKSGRLEFLNILDYPSLTNLKLLEEGIVIRGYHFFGLKTNEENTIVIASSSYKSTSLISNFSFFYLLILFAFALLFIIARFLNKEIIFNLSSKIQLYLGISLVLPMLIVSIALLNTLNESYKEEIDKSSSKKAYNISAHLLSAFEQFFSNQINRDDFNNLVSEAASLIQSDINVYTSTGDLLVSSEAEIFNSGLLGSHIAPDPYNSIKYGNAESVVNDQSIGDLNFRVSYVGLRSHIDGQLLGILSLPYFDSKNHLTRQQVEVFNNLISIFTIIFILSILFGNLAIEKLVRPLKMITERLKLTDLKEVNKPIAYASADEIGLLIQEYNTMITKLEDSKIALAESQKESAWKEIAKQVAHEIKNPLTPMRLKIQQMMREKERDSKEYNSMNSLIGQIDTLSSIADSFSAFAKMPAPKNERFDIIELIRNVADVHSNEGVHIDTKSIDGKAYVNTDPKIFSGILNNITLNALQSVHEKKPEVRVAIDLRPKKIIIQVHDNGSGIDELNKEKIFTPYFSTKSTGSGIGLAVAKKGIENAGGNIWFESKVGEGTTFFISLPVVY